MAIHDQALALPQMLHWIMGSFHRIFEKSKVAFGTIKLLVNFLEVFCLDRRGFNLIRLFQENLKQNIEVESLSNIS